MPTEGPQFSNLSPSAERFIPGRGYTAAPPARSDSINNNKNEYPHQQSPPIGGPSPLVCPICQQRYDMLVRGPYALFPCGCTICATCLWGVVGSMTCPLDGQPFQHTCLNQAILMQLPEDIGLPYYQDQGDAGGYLSAPQITTTTAAASSSGTTVDEWEGRRNPSSSSSSSMMQLEEVNGVCDWLLGCAKKQEGELRGLAQKTVELRQRVNKMGKEIGQRIDETAEELARLVMETRDRMVQDAVDQTREREAKLQAQKDELEAAANELYRLRKALETALCSPYGGSGVSDCVGALLERVNKQGGEELGGVAAEDDLEYRPPHRGEKKLAMAMVTGDKVLTHQGTPARLWGSIQKKAVSCPIKLAASVGGGLQLLKCPRQLAMDEHCLYVVDSDAHHVVVVEKETLVQIKVIDGSSTTSMEEEEEEGSGKGGRFQSPVGVAVDQTRLYVSEHEGDCVRCLDKATGEELWKTAEEEGEQQGLIKGPWHVAVDEDYVYVTVMVGRGVVVLEKGTGRYVRCLGGHGEFGDPFGLALDSSGHLYCSDYSRHCVWVVGKATSTILRHYGTRGEAGDGVDQFNQPRGLVVVGKYLLVCDSSNDRVMIMDKETGDHVAMVGGRTSTLSKPQSVVVDEGGKMFVSLYGSKKVQVVEDWGAVK